jgi:hypothetical protein
VRENARHASAPLDGSRRAGDTPARGAAPCERAGLFAHEIIEGRVAVKYEPLQVYMNREWLSHGEVE